MIEIDERGVVDRFVDTADAAGVDVVAKLAAGYAINSPRGGRHFYFWCQNVSGNTKLASRPAPTKQNPRAVDTLIETRGTGGFAVTAPSHGTVHTTGRSYTVEVGDPSTVPIISPDEQDELFGFARIFDESGIKEVKPTTRNVTIDGDRPGDRYNAAATRETFERLLPGWQWLFEHAGTWYVRRPGKDRGVSASWNWDGRGRLRVFTTSTDLEPQMYSAFALRTHVDFGGDWSACAKALYAEGFGKRPYTAFDYSEDGPPAGSNAVPAIQLTDTLRVADHRFWAQEDFAPRPLCNFEARISHYVTEAVGSCETRRFYRMVGALHDGTELPAVDISTDDLGQLHLWPGRSGPLWARCTLEPGFTVRDRVRACIQYYSQREGISTLTRYAATGWCEHEGTRVFRMHRSTIGPDGFRPDVDVDLDGAFRHYSFPAVAADDELRALARRYLTILDLAPDPILAPIVLAPARAILGEFLPVDSATYLYGATGTFKTELSVLALAHFGPTFTARSIPLNFEGTSNSTEAATYRAKDVVTVVDDFVPEGSKGQREATYAKLSRLARGAGNRAGRTRLNADTSAKQTYYARGLIIASGEDLPHGQSATARLQAVEVPAGAVAVDVLTACQRMARDGAFAKLTAAFIQRIAKDWTTVAAHVDTLHQRALQDMRGHQFRHRRTADAIAPQLVAAQVWFEFLRATDGISADERDAYVERMRAGLLMTGAAQDGLQHETSPVDTFVGNIRSAVLRGDAHLADRECNDLPPYPARFGWKTEVRKVGDHLEPVSTPKGSLIGWIDIEADAAYLDPTSAYAIAQRLGEQSGRTIPTSVTTLGKRLDDAKLLVSTETGRVQQKIYVQRQAQRVWHFRLSTLFPAEDAVPVEHMSFRREEVAS